MKKIIGILFVSSFLIAGVAFAQTGMMGGQSGMMGYRQTASSTAPVGDNTTINAALQDIYKGQDIIGQTQIDCAKVTDDQFEKLGDAYMGYGITEQQHTAMENMMGGEGSATLKQAHINMGRSNLGCWSNYNGAPSMMGSGMMGGSALYNGYPTNYSGGYGMMGRSSMMGAYYGGYAWFGAITMFLFWILSILGIIALVKWLMKSKN